MPAANTVAFGAVLAGVGVQQAYRHHERMKAKKREAEAEREARLQAAASKRFAEEMRQRAEDWQTERDQSQWHARSQQQDSLRSWIDEVQLEFTAHTEKQLGRLIARLERMPGASWTRSSPLAVALCIACCSGDFDSVERLLIDQMVNVWAESQQSVSALGLSCTRISLRSAQVALQWLDDLAAEAPLLSTECMGSLSAICANSSVSGDGERQFDVIDLSSDTSGAVFAKLQRSLGIFVVPLSNTPGGSESVYRNLQAQFGVRWVSQETHCAQDIEARIAYKRRADAIANRSEFKSYGAGKKYMSNAALQQAYRAAQNQAYEEYKTHSLAARATGVTKFCYVASQGCALDQEKFKQLPVDVKARMLATNFPVHAGFEFTLDHRTKERSPIQPLTGPDRPVLVCDPDNYAMLERNAKVRGVFLSWKNKRTKSGQRANGSKPAQDHKRALPTVKNTRALRRERAQFFAEAWLARQAQIIHERLQKISETKTGATAKEPKGVACLLGASIEHCCAIGGSLTVTGFVFPLLKMMRERDLSMLDDEIWRRDLEATLVASILSTVPPSRSSRDLNTTNDAQQKHEAQANAFATEYVDMIRGGHRRPARSAAGLFPYQIVQSSTPCRDAIAGIIQYGHPDAGEAQLEYELRSFHDAHEAEAKAAGPLLAKSTAIEPMWWIALCNGLLLAFGALTFWSVWVLCEEVFWLLDVSVIYWVPASMVSTLVNTAYCCLTVFEVAAMICIVCGTVHYFGSIADCASDQDCGWWASMTSTPTVFMGTRRAGFIFLAEARGWVTQMELDLQFLEQRCENQVREWELRLLSADIERHVRTNRITTTELRYLLHDLSSATDHDEQPSSSSNSAYSSSVEFELPCSVQMAEAFLKVEVAVEKATQSSDSKKVAGRDEVKSSGLCMPRRRVVDILETAGVDAVSGIPSTVIPSLECTDKDEGDEGFDNNTQSADSGFAAASSPRFSISERVEWCVGFGCAKLLDFSTEKGNTVDDLSISGWCEHHHLTHLQTRLEKNGVDRWCLRDLANDEDLRVELIMDESMEFNEAEEHQMLQALELPDGTWFKGTVIGGGNTGTEVLLDDGRTVYVSSIENANGRLLRPLSTNPTTKTRQKQAKETSNGKKSAENVRKKPSKAMTIEQAISEDGWEVKRGGKHIKLFRKLVLDDGSEIYQRGPTLSCTPSDIRARQNQLADFNRLRIATFEQMELLGNAPSQSSGGTDSPDNGSMACKWQANFR